MFKIKRRTNKIIRGALFLLALLFSFHITVKQVIHAKTIPNVITSMKVTDSDGNPLQGDLKKWQDFKVSATFSLPNNTVEAGDTTTIDFPKQLVYNSPNKSFNIVSSQGDIVAVANIDATNKKIVLTYTDYVEKHSDIKGTFDFHVRFDHREHKVNGKVDLEFKIDGKITNAGKPGFVGAGEAEKFAIVKGGWPLTNDPERLGYDVAINRTQETFKNAVIEDEFVGNGVIEADSVKIIKGVWLYNSTTSEWELQQAEDVTAKLKANIIVNKRKATVKIGDIASNEGYYINYKVKLNGEPKIGDAFINKVKLTADNTVDRTTEVETRYVKANGKADGQNFTIKVKKVDANGQPLSNAEFQVIRNRTKEVVGTITTDANGMGELSHLLKDEYTLKESKTPDGYEKRDEKFKISPSDFGTEQTVLRTIVNQKVVNKKIKISKLNPNGKMISGAKLHVYKGEGTQGEVVASWTSELGKTHELSLDPGIYTFHEETAPNGYKAVSDIVFEVTTAGQVNILKAKNNTATVKNDRLNITDQFDEARINISVVKHWDDKDNQAGKRPNHITVNLLADRKKIESQTIKPNENGKWHAEFTNKPKYKNGKEIHYTITEEVVASYRSEISGDAASGFVLKNLYDPSQPPAPKQKILPRTGTTVMGALIVVGLVVLNGSIYLAKRKNR
ncbi:SpaA isopeptide-forming pilin-related protein [Streptococcus anginosus]|uniref:SpaA isopeptide-forming pilin-related protein n=1 Tax=Streptococcus anginosus TaxID=1328 RepID=UPI0003549ECE|nr:Ig-like domain-containing protein [Streptococcus anginosus]MDB8661136.1 SpaA isopeptide-forming pilin-related protein [Streptococcus anginosus]BAN61029.1 hypothetical protein ANG_0559 [Streptococcus anginosus subsp. whileyi MAS624]